MAVTQVVEHEAAAEAPRHTRVPRSPAAAWSTESQLRKSLPIVRLLAELWAISDVAKIGLLADEDGIQVRVLMAKNDRDARAKVHEAERAYLNGTSPHRFDLRVTPVSNAGRNLPSSFETLLER